jgi:hypothetical protein
MHADLASIDGVIQQIDPEYRLDADIAARRPLRNLARSAGQYSTIFAERRSRSRQAISRAGSLKSAA